MSDSGDRSRISIGAVSEATGIPVGTLRTWERRYGFPDPARTEAGHRRFSREVLDHLRLTSRAIDEGHRPSEVVGLSKEKLRDLVEADEEAGDRKDSADSNKWLVAWMEATEKLDGQRLERYFQRAWNRLGAVEFLQSRATPYLQRVGESWAEGKLAVAGEHYASQQLRDFLADRWRTIAERSSGPRVICAAPEDELHGLGAHFVAVVFALAGWQVLFLGPHTPTRDILEPLDDTSVAAIAVTVTGSYDPSRATGVLEEIRRESPGDVQVVAGGAGAPPDLEGIRRFETLEACFEWASQVAQAST